MAGLRESHWGMRRDRSIWWWDKYGENGRQVCLSIRVRPGGSYDYEKSGIARTFKIFVCCSRSHNASLFWYTYYALEAADITGTFDNLRKAISQLRRPADAGIPLRSMKRTARPMSL